MPNQTNDLFPGFKYPAGCLIKYIESAGLFQILLRDDTTTSFEPKRGNVEKFHIWLKQHNIENIKGSTH